MRNLSFSSLADAILFCQQNLTSLVVLFAKQNIFLEHTKALPDNLIITSSEASISVTGRSTKQLVGFSAPLAITQVIPIAQLPMLTADKLETAYNQVKANPNACLFLLCDGINQREEMLLNSLYFIDKQFKVIGGTAADAFADKTSIYYGSQNVSNLAIFLDITQPTNLIKENLYHTTGKQLLVTHADTITRTVYTLNNQPAALEYARQLNTTVEELPNKFLSNPIGKVINGDIFIASPEYINSDMSITFYSQIVPNTFIELLTLADLEQTMLATQQAITTNPQFVFSIHCILRDTYLNQSNQWQTIINNLSKINPAHTGFVSYGEQLSLHHLNQTMTILTIG